MCVCKINSEVVQNGERWWYGIAWRHARWTTDKLTSLHLSHCHCWSNLPSDLSPMCLNISVMLWSSKSWNWSSLCIVFLVSRNTEKLWMNVWSNFWNELDVGQKAVIWILWKISLRIFSDSKFGASNDQAIHVISTWNGWTVYVVPITRPVHLWICSRGVQSYGPWGLPLDAFPKFSAPHGSKSR